MSESNPNGLKWTPGSQNRTDHPWSVAIVQAMKLKAAREVGRRLRAKVKREAKGEANANIS